MRSSADSVTARSEALVRSFGLGMVRTGHGPPGRTRPSSTPTDRGVRSTLHVTPSTASLRDRSRRQSPLRAGLTLATAAALLAASLLGAMAASVVQASAALAPATAPILVDASTSLTPLSGSITFYGRGYGHGVGMSQYGAKGRALAGEDVATILAHYYQGTSLSTIDPSVPIRVRVLSRWKAAPDRPLVIYGRRAAWTIDGIDATYPADARLTLRPTTTIDGTTTVSWRLQIDAGGTLLLDRAMNHSFRIRPSTIGGRLELASKPSSFDTYRRVLRVFPKSTAPTVTVVNELKLETYLRGVVPAEMPSTWPATALEAQAVVARSYAAARLRSGVGKFDVGDDTSWQVYHGSLAERSATTNAIIGTAGRVVMSGGSIANTLYHSTGGAATEDNENVFVTATGDPAASPVSYLRGSSDRDADGKSYDAASPYATWRTASYSLSQLSSWLATDSRTSVGTLSAIDLSDRGVSGRLIAIKLVGTKATKTVSANLFRSVFNANRPSADPSMRSTLFYLTPLS
jgi:stage II sporulation protein D